ncbi:hypothetical protein LCGC14_0892160 [marine sediment metagenome]|uniref:Uncharacterized protein n=1 Tax=marine sediment metagenome TaxID=412755 RepID=A0A0F9S5W6_9ZZZZ
MMSLSRDTNTPRGLDNALQRMLRCLCGWNRKTTAALYSLWLLLPRVGGSLRPHETTAPWWIKCSLQSSPFLRPVQLRFSRHDIRHY